MVNLCFSSMCKAIYSYSFGTLSNDMYLFLVFFIVTISRHVLLRTCLFFYHSRSLPAYSDLFIRDDEKSPLLSDFGLFPYGLFVCRLWSFLSCFEGVSICFLCQECEAYLYKMSFDSYWITKTGIFSSEKNILKKYFVKSCLRIVYLKTCKITLT